MYIGQAGKKPSAKEKGTLLRGVTELFRETFSSDAPGYKRLDTDFVVGAAIRFFELQVGSVFWEHLSNDPNDESQLFQKHTPLIQKGGAPQLLPQLKVEMGQHHWKLKGTNLEKRTEKMREAELRVFDELKALLSGKPLA